MVVDYGFVGGVLVGWVFVGADWVPSLQEEYILLIPILIRLIQYMQDLIFRLYTFLSEISLHIFRHKLDFLLFFELTH